MKLKAIPILRIFDEEKAKEFYVEFLGMKIDWEHRFEDNAPLYLQVSKEKLILHLSEHSGDCSPGAKVFVEVESVETIYNEIKDKNYRYNKSQIETAPWGDKTITFIDPFSNKILFNQNAGS